MNLKQMSYIIVLSEEKSTSKAAAKIGITQSALSKYLYTLENILGVKLFTRSGRMLAPTYYGNIYIDAVREILSTYQYTCQAISRLSNPQKEDLFIGFSSRKDLLDFSNIITRFQSAHPDTILHTVFASQEDFSGLLLTGKIIVSLQHLATPITDAALVSVPLSKISIACALPSIYPELPELSCGSSSPELNICAIADLPFILPSPKTAIRVIINNYFAMHNIKPFIICECDDTDALLTMVENGVGAAFIPEREIKNSSKIHYQILNPAYFLTQSIVFRSEQVLSDNTQCLLHFLQQHFIRTGDL